MKLYVEIDDLEYEMLKMIKGITPIHLDLIKKLLRSNFKEDEKMFLNNSIVNPWKEEVKRTTYTKENKGIEIVITEKERVL